MESRRYNPCNIVGKIYLDLGPGQSIAVAREPPSVAVYSIQDGHRIHVLSVLQDGQTSSLCGVWWFSDEDSMKTDSNIPDIFKRNGIIVSIFGRHHSGSLPEPYTEDRLSSFYFKNTSTT